MARKTSKFLVGLFVIAGTVITAIAIIYIGATKYFETGKRYVIYFDESVQGLQRDSEVKYRGVTAGRVLEIRIAQDNKLIAVIINLFLKDYPAQNVVAQLRMTGITGLMFVNLDVIQPGDRELSPKIDFVSEYPVIPSKPSEIKLILAGLEEILSKVRDLDTKGISDELKSTVTEIGNFFRNREMKTIVANFEATSKNLAGLSKRLDRLVASGKVEQVLLEGRDALKSANTLFAGIQDELKAAKIPAIGGRTRAVLTEVSEITRRLEVASESLDQLLNRLKNRPSDLLFGQEPKPRWNER